MQEGRTRRAREQCGWTQSALADLLGENATTVSNYENGNRGISIIELPQLPEVLQVPIAFFFEESVEVLTQQRPPHDVLMQEFIQLLTVSR